ncbi:MAG: hypothetical protein ACSHX0_01485 [Akkermansiaceae bacterium]
MAGLPNAWLEAGNVRKSPLTLPVPSLARTIAKEQYREEIHEIS